MTLRRQGIKATTLLHIEENKGGSCTGFKGFPVLTPRGVQTVSKNFKGCFGRNVSISVCVGAARAAGQRESPNIETSSPHESLNPETRGRDSPTYVKKKSHRFPLREVKLMKVGSVL